MIRGSRLSENKHWQQTEQLMKNRVFDIFILSYYNRQRVEDSVKAIICDCLQGKEEDTLIPKISEINDEITKLDVNYLRIYYQYKRDIKVDVDYFREAFISSTWRRDSSGNDPYINHGYPQIPELENIENNPVIEALLAESDFGYTPDGEIDIFESEIETDKYRHFKPFSPTIELLFKHCELFVLLRRKSLLKEELKKYRFKQSQDDFLVHRQSKETEKKTTDQPQIIVSEPNPTISETKKQKQTPIYGFKWTNDKTDTATFYNFLKPLIFWDKETDKETLDKIKMAFGGEEITVPLKIKWKIKHRNSGKAAIIKVIKHWLMDGFKLIEFMDNSTLAATLDMIFVDDNGQPFKNWEVSLIQVKNKHDGDMKWVYEEISEA